MHYTRFASICQNSFNFESFTHYRKWLNHAVYAVYTKSAKLCPNHRKSTYSSGFMHFFRKFLPNLFLPLRFPPRYLWYFPYKEACFNCLFGIKTQQIVKEKKSRIVFHRQWINLLFTFSPPPNFQKFKKNPLDRQNFIQKSPSIFNIFPLTSTWPSRQKDAPVPRLPAEPYVWSLPYPSKRTTRQHRHRRVSLEVNTSSADQQRARPSFSATVTFSSPDLIYVRFPLFLNVPLYK